MVGAQGSGVIISQVMPHPGNATLPIVREYLRLLQPPASPASSTTPASRASSPPRLHRGLRRAGKDLTREKLVTALESMRSYDLGGFIVNFTPENHVGSKFVEMTIIIRRGR